MKDNKQREMLERLRNHLAHKTTDKAPHSLQVPASHYVSEEQLEHELEMLFRKRPLLVALTPHIPNPGDYLTHEAVDTSLLLVRDRAENARAYINPADIVGHAWQKAWVKKPPFPAPSMRGTGAWTGKSLPGPTVTMGSRQQMPAMTNWLKYLVTKRQG